MDALAKVLEFVGKYAWAVFVTACFVLFIPDDAAKQIGLLELRQSFKGILWILMVLTVVVSLGAAFQYLDKRVFDGWLKNRQNKKESEAQEKKNLEMLSLRLRSLDLNEQMWIKYCLYHNSQTLSAERGNRTAQSLDHKEIVQAGSGHILDLPFHIPDQVWRYLLEHKDEFLPKTETNDKRFVGALENFRKSLWASY